MRRGDECPCHSASGQNPLPPFLSLFFVVLVEDFYVRPPLPLLWCLWSSCLSFNHYRPPPLLVVRCQICSSLPIVLLLLSLACMVLGTNYFALSPLYLFPLLRSHSSCACGVGFLSAVSCCLLGSVKLFSFLVSLWSLAV